MEALQKPAARRFGASEDDHRRGHAVHRHRAGRRPDARYCKGSSHLPAMLRPMPAATRSHAAVSAANPTNIGTSDLASRKAAEHIVSLERSALDRWVRADPDGYLSLCARDATCFDPFREKRVDGRDELHAALAAMRGVKLPFTEPRYDMINPVIAG